MKIAVLGWGSLIPAPGSLAKLGDWQDAKLFLPIEFSRVSNNGRLTLVIDEKDGAPVETSYVLSPLPTLQEAIDNLWEREGKPQRRHIGFADISNKATASEAKRLHPNATKGITQWAVSRKLDAVIWTGLPSNFEEKTGRPFSVDAAREYFFGLEGEVRERALHYLRDAPARVVTPVRQAIEIELKNA